MNEDPLTVTLTQISQLVVTLNKKNVAQSSRQISQVNYDAKFAYVHSGRPFCHFPLPRTCGPPAVRWESEGSGRAAPPPHPDVAVDAVAHLLTIAPI